MPAQHTNPEHLPQGQAQTRAHAPGRQRFFYAVAALAVATVLLFSPLVQGARSESPAFPRSAGPATTEPVSFSSHTRFPPAHPAAVAVPPHAGFWHTAGAEILDAHGNPVRIAGLNWSGLETTEALPGGLDHHDYREILRSVAAAGYNTIRLPFSNEMVEHPAVPDHLGLHGDRGPINQDLAGLTSLEIMDKVIGAAGDLGLKVILDNHRSEAGSSAEASGLWYTPDYPEQHWISDWTALAARYRGNSTVIGFDLRNEPHNADNGGSCWDCGGAHDWHLAAGRAGNAILRVNPGVLIFVEGTDTDSGEPDFWGGNLLGARRSPVALAVPHRLVYSPHVYGPAEYAQSWFNPSTTPASLAALWRRHWAFLAESNIAPVWVGEFGVPDADALPGAATPGSAAPGSEAQWFQSLVGFLSAHPSIGWAYWGLNGEDRYALFDSNYSLRDSSHAKLAALNSLQQPGTDLRPAADAQLPSALAQPTSSQVAAASRPRVNVVAAARPQPRATSIDAAIADQVRQSTARALGTSTR